MAGYIVDRPGICQFLTLAETFERMTAELWQTVFFFDSGQII